MSSYGKKMFTTEELIKMASFDGEYKKTRTIEGVWNYFKPHNSGNFDAYGNAADPIAQAYANQFKADHIHSIHRNRFKGFQSTTPDDPYPKYKPTSNPMNFDKLRWRTVVCWTDIALHTTKDARTKDDRIVIKNTKTGEMVVLPDNIITLAGVKPYDTFEEFGKKVADYALNNALILHPIQELI